MTTAELVARVKKNPVISAGVLVSLGLALAIYFRMDAIPAANAELDTKSALAQRYALNITHAVQLKEHLDALKTANQVIDARMLRATDIGINQQYFYKLETESGVKLTDLRQGRVIPTKGTYSPIGFNVSLEGDFGQVLRFLRGLEDGTHYCRVVGASCTGGRSGHVALTLNLELLGRP